jgi:hypothetical protein
MQISTGQKQGSFIERGPYFKSVFSVVPLYYCILYLMK